MSKASLRHCVLEIFTLWNKCELHLFSHQRLNFVVVLKKIC